MSKPEKVEKEDTRNRFQKLYDEKYRPKQPTLTLLPQHNVASSNRPHKHLSPLALRNTKDPAIADALANASQKKLEALHDFRYY